MKMSLLDLFCGVGGWSKSFAARGWRCVGVDKAALGYPYEFVQSDVLDLTDSFLNSFDAIVASPPCEEFARAWLPWLRGDKKPAQWAIDLLEWSVNLCKGKKNRITECSNFAARHVPGGTRFGSYTLWGDVPLLMPQLPRGKMARSGMNPELRAEIPPALADWIADNYTRAYRSNMDLLDEKKAKQRIREGVLEQINRNPELKRAYDLLVKDLPEDQKENVIAQIARSAVG